MELKVADENIPVKIGCYTLEKFCESYKIGLSDIGDVFETKEITGKDGKKETIDMPKDIIKFLATIIFHGANYASMLTNGTSYDMPTVYNWIDEIGLTSDQSVKVMALFIGAIKNGGNPIQLPDSMEKKGKKKALNVA